MAAEIGAAGLDGDRSLASLDDLPDSGEFDEAETMGILGRWVATAHRHHQFFAPGYVERLSSGDADATGPPFEVPRVELHDGVGLVTLPGLKVPDSDSPLAVKYAVTLDRGLRALENEAHGWVVDLSARHTGGNMHPVLAGLVGLLGTGRLCGFAHADGHREWVEATRENILVDGVVVAAVPDGRPLAARPVAVVIGPLTISSGEFVALCLRHRCGARLFGRPTAGYLSSAQLRPLPCGAMLGLANALAIDGNGLVSAEHLDPHVQTEAADMATPIRWLRSTGPPPR